MHLINLPGSTTDRIMSQTVVFLYVENVYAKVQTSLKVGRDTPQMLRVSQEKSDFRDNSRHPTGQGGGFKKVQLRVDNAINGG